MRSLQLKKLLKSSSLLSFIFSFESMNREYYIVLVLAIAFITLFIIINVAPAEETVIAASCTNNPDQSRIALPEPDFKGALLEEAIEKRRSERDYSEKEISLAEASMLLWAGGGITDEHGFRTAPSAGALYPIDIYLVPNRVENASCGVYRYMPDEHELVLVKEGEFSEGFYNASYGQKHIRDAALLIVMVSTPERTTSKYGEIGKAYILIEAGHIAQNILLEGTSLGIKTTPVGGFEREKADDIIGLEEGKSIYMITVGK
jgi:SagB-type dehydrogenase family enzyme